MSPAEKRSADAIAPRLTRATGPIQPRFTASTKKKTTPRSVTMPPAQASTFAEKRSAKVSPLHHGGSFGAGGGAGGRGREGGGLGAATGGGTGAGSRTGGGGAAAGVSGTTGGGASASGGPVGAGASAPVETARRRSASSFSRAPSRWAKSSTLRRRSSVGSGLGGWGLHACSRTGTTGWAAAGADVRRDRTSITRKSGATKVFNHQKNVCFQTSANSSFARTMRTESAIQSGTAQRAQMTATGTLPASAKIAPKTNSQKNPSP